MDTKKKKPTHALFWALLRETKGYIEAHKELIKEGIVHQYSGGRTTSLSEMYRKYPAAYSRMIEEMKGDFYKRQARYEAGRDRAAKRVIAAICQWLDKQGYIFRSREEKIRYVLSVACRAANCGNFNAISESRLTAIYNLFCRKNSVDISGNPIIDYSIMKN